MTGSTIVNYRCVSWVVMIGCVAAGFDVIQAQQPRNVDIAVVGGRPLAAAVRELEVRNAWVITYEDPIYESPTLIEDVTSSVSRDPNSSNRVLVPRSRSFGFRYVEDDIARPQQLIPAMVREYNLIGYGDEFSVVQRGSVFHVLPVSSLDTNGVATRRESRLSARVTFDPAERTVLEVLQLVLDQVGQGTDEPVRIGTVPVNLLARTSFEGGAAEEPARDVLLRALEVTGARLSWRLLCSPAGSLSRECALNVHQVPAEPPS